MRIRSVFPIAIVAAGIMASASASAYAATDVPVLTHASFSKSQKNVNVSLRNDSGTPLELKVGEQVMSVDAGKTLALKVAVGTRIVMNTATATHPAGEVLTQANAAMNNATIVIR